MFFASIKCGHIPAARHPSQKTLKIKHHRPGFGDGMNMLQSDKNNSKMDQQGTCTNPGLQQSGQPTPTSKGHLNFMCIKKSHVQTCHLLKDGNETWTKAPRSAPGKSCNEHGDSCGEASNKYAIWGDFRDCLVLGSPHYYGLDGIWWNNPTKMRILAQSKITGPGLPWSLPDLPALHGLARRIFFHLEGVQTFPRCHRQPQQLQPQQQKQLATAVQRARRMQMRNRSGNSIQIICSHLRVQNMTAHGSNMTRPSHTSVGGHPWPKSKRKTATQVEPIHDYGWFQLLFPLFALSILSFFWLNSNWK